MSRLWTALLALAALLFAGIVAVTWPSDPIVPADDVLPDLPAVTLDGVALDRAFFADRPWVVLVWLPG